MPKRKFEFDVRKPSQCNGLLSSDRIPHRQVLGALLGACTGLSLVYIAVLYWLRFRIVDWPMDVSGIHIGRDFANLWVAGRAAGHGNWMVLFDGAKHIDELARQIDPAIKAAGYSHVWSYPPTAIWLGLPFSRLPYIPSLAIWSALSIAAVVWAMLVKSRSRTLSPLAIFVIAIPGLSLSLLFGQVTYLTSAALIGGMVFARHRPWVAGALLATLVVKPQLGCVIPLALLAMGAWRAFATTALFCILYVAATVVYFGLEPWELFFKITLPFQLNNFLLQAMIGRNLTMTPDFAMLHAGLVPATALTLHSLSASLAVLIAIFVIYRLPDIELRVAAFAAATLLFSPYLLAYEVALGTVVSVRLLALCQGSPSHDFSHEDGRRSAIVSMIALSYLSAPLVGFLSILMMQLNFMALNFWVALSLLAYLATTASSRASETGEIGRAPATLLAAIPGKSIDSTAGIPLVAPHRRGASE